MANFRLNPEDYVVTSNSHDRRQGRWSLTKETTGKPPGSREQGDDDEFGTELGHRRLWDNPGRPTVA